MKVITAPTPYNNDTKPKLFLGGTIDDGESEDWQSEFIDKISDLDIDVLNPRRVNWDKNISEHELREQIYWELNGLQESNFIVINLLSGSLSPISLLELGLFGTLDNHMYVICDENYWRYVNVSVVCERYSIPHYKNIDEAILYLRQDIENYKFNS